MLLSYFLKMPELGTRTDIYTFTVHLLQSQTLFTDSKKDMKEQMVIVEGIVVSTKKDI